jgi:hypothetical protein
MQDDKAQNTYEALSKLRSDTRRTAEDHKHQPPALHHDEVTAKVIEDINFLRDRINHIKRSMFSNSNPTILKTYESMLESRESVLAWIKENDHRSREERHHNNASKS